MTALRLTKTRLLAKYAQKATPVFSFLCIIACPLYAQKFGYIDSEYILHQMPEYPIAQTKIDSLSTAGEQRIKNKYKEAQKARLDLQAEEPLLTQNMYKDRQEKIDELLEEAQTLQQEIFGFEGLYFLKQEELMTNMRDKLYKAVEKIAKKHKLQIVFDKSADIVMLYTDPIHDYTEFVLEELGLSKKETGTNTQRKRKSNPQQTTN